jgi:hypothetical protein
MHKPAQSTLGFIFQYVDWYIPQVENIFNALIGTIYMWKYFLIRELVQSTSGKYFQCINWHNLHVEVFFNELIGTFNE